MEFKDQEANHRDALSDEQLSTLLRKWEVDGAPANLAARVFAAGGASGRRRWWILIPAIACSVAFLCGAGLWLMRPRRVTPDVAAGATQPPAAARETPVAFNGPVSTTSARPDLAPATRPDDPVPARYAPAHVDFFSDPFGDSGRGSPFAAKPAPEPFPQAAPQPAQQQAQDAPPLPPGVYRPGNGVSAPSVLKKLDPEYAEEARIAKLSGAAILKLVIGEDGNGRDIVVTQPLGLGLDEKAVDSIKAWSFKPGVKDGAAVPVAATIQVNFRLENAAAQPWHLTRALFTPSAGAVRPILLQAPYPADAGSPDNDSVRVSFEVDANGVPINFHGLSAANPKLEAEAIGILSGWRFRPGTSNGKPVSTPATFDFAHVTSTGPTDGSAISVGGAVAAGNLIDKTVPVYPREAKAARVQGTVYLQVHIGKDGHVVSAAVIGGDPMLTPAALEAVRQWLYRPTLMNGNPVEVNTQVDVNFTLSQ